MAFIIFISFIIFLRLGELFLSGKNEKWLLQNGAIEYGGKHYPFIVALHTLFLISLIIEYYIKDSNAFSPVFIGLYLLLIAFKTWIISSLGKFWNTKIYRAQNFPLVKKGPYRYIKHPNYIIVVAEIIVIPLAFHLYYTAIIFSILNGVMLFIRIREENKILN